MTLIVIFGSIILAWVQRNLFWLVPLSDSSPRQCSCSRNESAFSVRGLYGPWKYFVLNLM